MFFLLIVDGLYVETVSPSPSFLCLTGLLLSEGNLGTDGKKARCRRLRMMAEGAWVGRRRLQRGKGFKSGAGARGWLQAHLWWKEACWRLFL